MESFQLANFFAVLWITFLRRGIISYKNPQGSVNTKHASVDVFQILKANNI